MEPGESPLARVFASPALFWDPEREHEVRTEPVPVGMLRLPTGKLAVHDPGYEFAPDVLDLAVHPGIYPVDIALRSWTASDGSVTPRSLIAAARLSFGAEAPERLVRVASSDGRELAFGVDSGLIAVFDRALVESLGGRAILDAIPGSSPSEGAAVHQAHIVTGSRGASVFVCQAGMGDGSYRAWWGFGEDDAPVSLIVDFGELEYSLWRTLEFPAASLLGSAAVLRLALAGSGLELEPVPFESTTLGVPPGMSGELITLRRPPGPHWEFSLRDADGNWIGGPGLGQLFPGPWFELFERGAVERAATVRVRIREGTAPLEPREG